MPRLLVATLGELKFHPYLPPWHVLGDGGSTDGCSTIQLPSTSVTTAALLAPSLMPEAKISIPMTSTPT